MYKKLLSIFVLVSALSLTLNAKVKTVQDMLDEAHKTVTDIDTQGVLDKLKEDPNIKIIDVRPVSDISDYGYMKANNVFRIHRAQLEWLIGQTVEENEEFIIHCNNGHISLLAALQLQKMGYKKVLHYGSGSFNAWRNENLPRRYTNKYKNSLLYSEVKKIGEGVYTSIGITAPYLYESTAHNNNLGFVIGKKYVLVWNAGSSYLLAQALHLEIKKITNSR